MVTKLKEVDVVIVGLGWTGGWKADFANARDGTSISMSAGITSKV